jgi:predicted hydrocarbon binding protein
MRFHLENAENHGIIRASLNHSLFAHTLKEVDGPVDYMIAGMLESIFSEISGQTLGCTQISYNYSGANTSEFLISGSARIANLEQVDIHNMNPNDALDVLRIA